MGCICCASGKLPSASLIQIHSFSLFEDRVTARSFECWSQIVPYLAPVDWLHLHLVSKRVKTLTSRKSQTIAKLPFASLNSLSISLDLSTAQDYRKAISPIQSKNSSNPSPFLTGQSIQGLLSSIASRSVTPLGVLPQTEDMEENLKNWKFRIWEDARLGKLDSLLNFISTGAKPLAAVLDLTFNLDRMEVKLSLLATAVSTGSSHLVQAVLERTLHPDLEDAEAEKGLIIERTEVDIDARMDRGALKKFQTNVSPLHFAAAKGYADIIEVLIGWGANVNLSGTHATDLDYMIKYQEFGMPPLLLAAKGLINDPIELELPLTVVPTPLLTIDFTRSCKLLIASGAQLNISAEEPLIFYLLQPASLLKFTVQCDRRPLDEACFKCYLESAEVLLESGSQPYDPPHNAFQYCKDHYELLPVLIKHYPVNGTETLPSLVYIFLQLGDLPLLTEVCSWPDIAINISETHQGYNLMHRLAQTKSQDFLQMLLPKITASKEEFEQAINKEVDGGTCLWLALPDYHFIEDLRALGGDIKQLRFVNVYRVYQTHKLLLQYLLAAGLNPNDTDEYGLTAFQYACSSFQVGMQVELIKLGCNVNCVDRYGNTPLHEACMKGYFVQAKLLLRHGANPRVTNRRGETPMDLISKSHRGKTVSIVKKLVALLRSHYDGTFID